ncbi:MAG: hypothetical protein DI539_00370 [Flavobacterium psychrophilum]|nr:MAG: hypothetical protein DI539_00370 [Flavobacterium psychrophilum]
MEFILLSCHKRIKKARLNSFGYKSKFSAKPFELATLKQRMLLNASNPDLLHTTEFNAVASLRYATTVSLI